MVKDGGVIAAKPAADLEKGEVLGPKPAHDVGARVDDVAVSVAGEDQAVVDAVPPRYLAGISADSRGHRA
jgi:hypothetical protein